MPRRSLGGSAVALLALSLLTTATGALTTAPASAAVVEPSTGIASGTNGIALGPDGNLWVAEQFNSTVAKVSPAGVVLQRIAMPGPPIGVSAGPGGTVWVTVPSVQKVEKIVAATGAVQSVDTLPASNCGPVAVANGGDGLMYVSLPNAGSCGATASALVTVDAATNVVSAAVTGRGTVLDLAVSGGKLFAPDYDGDVVRRMALGAALTVESAVDVTGGGPIGITTMAGEVFVALNSSQAVAHFPAVQNGGAAASFTAPPGSAPIGIAADANGQLVVTGPKSIYDLSTAGAFTAVPTPANADARDVVAVPGGDVWVTDNAKPRLLQVVDGKPTASVTRTTATSAKGAAAQLSIDPRGNTTQFALDYGATTAYGSVVTGQVAAGAAPVAQTVALTGLKPGKTYHLRLTASNVRGSFVGPDTTFTMPRQVKAKASFTWSVSAAGTILRTVKVARLAGGETITLRCKGGATKGCPFKKKVYKKVKKGTKDLSALFNGRLLKPGAKVVVTTSAAGLLDRTATLSVRAGKKPKITRG
jgi:streptogramin lyase